MKKILAIFLVLIMILSVALVSCKNDTAGTAGTTGDDDDGGLVANKNNKDDDDENKGADEGDVPPASAWVTENMPAKVYTMASVNLRTETVVKDTTIHTTVPVSTELTVLAMSSDKDSIEKPLWYKISYDSKELYVSGAWVSSNIEDTQFNSCDPVDLITLETYKDSTIYLRSLPAVAESTQKTSLKRADMTDGKLKKVGESKTGLWFEVEYDLDNNGKAEKYYIKMTSEIRKYFGLPTGSTGGNG
ncbi:MAG: hypothetical protein E7653_06580 [Ruminococcaceae bacterium]|nr:hypothetical protein [Oscillospiraceae bacterium]